MGYKSYIRTPELNRRMSLIKMGHKHSEKTKQKMRKPKTLTEKFLKAQKERGKKRENENHPLWKGDFADKGSTHRWVERRKPKPKFCEFCGEEKRLDLANTNGHNYKKNINHYMWLCHKCHYHYDKDKEYK